MIVITRTVNRDKPPKSHVFNLLYHQKQPLDVFCKKVVLKNFVQFTGKHLYQSLFFNKVACVASNFIKKETRSQVFSCEFCEIFKKTYFEEHLQTATSVTFNTLETWEAQGYNLMFDFTSYIFLFSRWAC